VPSKVLIADDSLKVQKELTQLLKDAGVDVVTVSNGEHAVRKLGTEKPDLVLADIFMPVRSGYEVCDYIKSNEEFAHIGVVLLASKMEPYDEKEAQRVRADGKIEKPFADPAAALAAIQQHLQKAAAQKPAAPAPPIEEFAAAVPSTAEPEPEPEPVQFSTRPAPVSFDTASPMGFTDMEETHAAPAPEPVDLSQATVLSTADEVKRRLEAPPAEEAPAPVAGFEPPPPTPAAEQTKIEKPELAAAWEMTGPQPGAPPVPVVGGFDSQWSGGKEGAAAEAPAEEAPAAEPQEKPYAPEEFAAAFSAAEAAPAPVEEAPPAAPPPVHGEPVQGEPALPVPPEQVRAAVEEAVAATPEVDPAVVERVVNEVLARLTPQVTESIAREIVRPLTEALLKEKPKS